MPEAQAPGRFPRRAALAAAATAVVAPALASATARAAEDEGAALTALVRAEQDAAFVYREAGLGELARQEEQHAQAVAAHLEALTLPVPRPRDDRSGLGTPALAVLDAASAGERRRAAIAFERLLIAGCEGRLARLSEANTVRTVASVLASHAQHRVVLELSGRR